MLLPVLRWWLVLWAGGWLAWPLTRRIWPASADGGYAYARICSLVLLGYVYWIGASLRLYPLDHRSLALTAAFLALVGVTLWWRDRRIMRELLRGAWRHLLTVELLFVVAYALVVALRAYDPMISHTEQPMDFALFNGILASPTLPPRDPWMAGQAISYYYGGHWLVALLARLTRTPSGMAYNLGLAQTAGLGVVAAYGLLGQMLSGEGDNGKHTWRLGAGLGALALFTLGTLEWPLECLRSLGYGAERFWRWLSVPGLAESTPNGSIVPNGGWWWWRASRVIYDVNWQGRLPTVITEFPAFSLILGDLHAHLMTLPMLLMGVGLGFALARRPFSRRAPESRLPWLLAPILLGWLGFSNSWDLLTVGIWIVGWCGLVRWRDEGLNGRSLGALALTALWLAGMSVLLYLPFYRELFSQVRGLGTVHYAKTRLVAYWLIYGLWLPPIVGEVWRRRKGLTLKTFLLLWAGLVLLPWGLTGAMGGWGALLWSGVATALSGPWLTLLLSGLMAALLLDIWRLARTAGSDDGQLRWNGLCLLGLGLTWGVEFLYLRDSFDARTNTVFKFGYQAWMLLGLAALSAMMRAWRRGERSRCWALAALLLLASCIGYAPAAAYSKTAGFSRALELDGTAYLLETAPDEDAALRWLREHATVDDVLVEAPGTEFAAWTSRFSGWSGIPSVLGWPGHEAQWRGDESEVLERTRILDGAYCRMDDETLGALAPYGATLLIIGSAERERYGADLAEPVLESVFSGGSVSIYRLR